MPYKDPDYHKKYREQNKEKRKQSWKEYYEKNKEKISENKKEYRQNNKEKVKEYRKEYRQTPKGKKCYKISKWKNDLNIKLRPDEDWDSVYEYYLICELCEECNVKLTTDRYNTSTTKCLDHDHDTGFIRNIICHCCNCKRG
tara:strand:+ start:208 stop:633 length:426 start_codon:yes stop_codon:yes gene_type:complete